jgi:hypothetical protein
MCSYGRYQVVLLRVPNRKAERNLTEITYPMEVIAWDAFGFRFRASSDVEVDHWFVLVGCWRGVCNVVANYPMEPGSRLKGEIRTTTGRLGGTQKKRDTSPVALSESFQ